MKINHIVDEDITRRGFLQGAGAAAVAGATGVSSAGDFRPADRIAPRFKETWEQRSIELKNKGNDILQRLLGVAGNWADKLGTPVIRTTIGDSQFRGGANITAQIVNGKIANSVLTLETTVLWDAPDEVIAWIMAHELGHIAYQHNQNAVSPAQAKDNEKDADIFGAYLCKKLGYNKASVFKFLYNQEMLFWKMGNAELNVRDDPASQHPTPKDRIKNVNTQMPDFQLSKNSVNYIKSVLSHLAEGRHSRPPDIDDFDTPDDYEEALARWKSHQVDQDIDYENIIDEPDNWFDESKEKVGNMDADAFDAALARMKKLAGAGPLKTVYDPTKRVYKNVPHAVQPAQQPKKAPR